jgi:predicted nucleic acid-binding protein
MHYLDASILVAAVTAEATRAHVQRWLSDHDDNLALSSWTLTEISAALSLKLRTGQITEAEKASGLRQIEALRNTVLMLAAVDETHFFAARRFADQHETGLRAGDALHVAIAADYDMILVTLDKKMAVGAAILGVEVVLMPSNPAPG